MKPHPLSLIPLFIAACTQTATEQMPETPYTYTLTITAADTARPAAIYLVGLNRDGFLQIHETPEPFSAAKPYRVQLQLAKPPAEVKLQIQYGSQDRFIHARCRPEPRDGGTLQIMSTTRKRWPATGQDKPATSVLSIRAQSSLYIKINRQKTPLPRKNPL